MLNPVELGSIRWDSAQAKIDLMNTFNLYPKIQLLIDSVDSSQYDPNSSKVRLFTNSYDVSSCATNIRIKTVMYNNCGQLSFTLIHPDCRTLFKEGDRVRLYLDDKCKFCGFIFSRTFSQKREMQVVAFDYLRYFKAQQIYSKTMMRSSDGKTGLTASEIFTKICQDLKIPFEIKYTSTVPVPAQNWDKQSCFNIMEFAINQTIINSDEAKKEYLIYFHESDVDEQILKEQSGVVQLHSRTDLTTNVPITDSDLITDYNYQTTIDKQTYNRIILYKTKKSYLGKDGKTLKNGKKTGTIVRVAPSSPEKYKETSEGLYGYLPYFHQCPDSYTEAQMDKVAGDLLKILDRKTSSLTLQCYGVIGMRAGYLVPVAILNIGDTFIGSWKMDEKTNEIYLLPEYRTVKECELIVEHPLKMNLTISSAEEGEYNL